MPIYEYQCIQCGHQLEAFQGLSEKPLIDCPKCHQPSLEKLISAAGLQFKGTGWYKTDYSNKGKAKPTKEAEGGADSGGGVSNADGKSGDAQSKTPKTSSKEDTSQTSSSSSSKSGGTGSSGGASSGSGAGGPTSSSHSGAGS